MEIVTAKMQYDGEYPVNSIDAKNGNIVARKSRGDRNYGYQLFNARLGKAFHWYRYKRDALKKIEEIKTCG